MAAMKARTRKAPMRTVKKIDLLNALAAPEWRASNCLLAQALVRILDIPPRPPDIKSMDSDALQLMQLFDSGAGVQFNHPFVGVDPEMCIAMLAAVLPMECRFDV
jgi:hypothetical protein